jgi:hypothetical protein
MKGQIMGMNSSGNFINVFFKLENGKSAHTFTGKQYRNYAIWRQFKVGDWVEGLNWKNEGKRLIDADSPAYLAC